MADTTQAGGCDCFGSGPSVRAAADGRIENGQLKESVVQDEQSIYITKQINDEEDLKYAHDEVYVDNGNEPMEFESKKFACEE